jgi:hypothetical protein
MTSFKYKSAELLWHCDKGYRVASVRDWASTPQQAVQKSGLDQADQDESLTMLLSFIEEFWKQKPVCGIRDATLCGRVNEVLFAG